MSIITSDITLIIYTCLLDSVFPDSWKNRIVVSLAKISSQTAFSDFRHISILPLIYKVLEKAVYCEIRAYLEVNNIFPELQSRFRSQHGCVSALAHVNN